MSAEKDFFLQNVKVILSPQEKQGKTTHITEFFNKWGVKWEKLYAPNHLRQGDYSFIIQGKDYRDEFLIERKFGVSELYNCITQRNIITKAKQETSTTELRDNLEYEFARMCKVGVVEKWLFIENCPSVESIKEWRSGYEQRKCTHESMVYATINSWASENRYGFKIECVPNKANVASVMLSKMYYYWRNAMKNQYGDNFLTQIKRNQTN